MNSSNLTLQPLDYWLRFYGFPNYLEILYIYIQTPFSVLAFALNLITFFILQKNIFSVSRFFKYMRFYVLNNSITSLLLISTFMGGSHRYLTFTNSFSALFYCSYFFAPIQSYLFFCSAFLEIAIVIQRALYFTPESRQSKLFKFIHTYKFFIALFVLCALVNIPIFMVFEPAYVDIQLDSNEWYRLYYFGTTAFSESNAGKLISYAVYLIRDMLTLVLKIYFNIKTVKLVKEYKNKIMADKLEFALRISSATLHARDNVVLNTSNNSYISKTDRNQTKIAIITCFFSLIEHFLNIFSYVLYFFKFNQAGITLYGSTLMSITFKNLINVFIFYKYNYLFRSEVKKYLKKFCC